MRTDRLRGAAPPPPPRPPPPPSGGGEGRIRTNLRFPRGAASSHHKEMFYIASSRPQRWLAGAMVVGVFGAAVAFLPRDGQPVNPVGPQPARAAQARISSDWTMYGGTPARN